MPQVIIDVCQAMPEVFQGLNLEAALTNGKVEAVLKTFLGITWVAGAVALGEHRTYLMDKQFGTGAGIDLVAFQQQQPMFWLECKCDFASDPRRARASAKKAFKQVRRYVPNLPGTLRERPGYVIPGYIVHFLCQLPMAEEHPEWVVAFDALVNNQPLEPNELVHFYNALEQAHRLTDPEEPLIEFVSAFATISLVPALQVVVLRVDGPPMH
jgi:hypothetical protein